MRFIEDLCPPALLYLIFLVVSLGLDLSLGMWYTAAIKTVVGIAFVYLLDLFCGIGLSPVSWFLVAAPFLITALATAVSIGVGFDDSVQVAQVKEQFGGTGGLPGKKDPNPAVPGIDPPADSNAIETVLTLGI
uniref:Uncharacterized protein n=1 Tax=viral metagenome TaxID=1070528 RepID=A0A6C0M2F1_9ZZZZ